ncbi:TIM barrel protein [Alkalibaculum sp. M08DMB]|uniref:TIM barrel protein n=1 Tax=Alkalibaculum sporogenes TaxID=2655001 RepID=A0A6A7KB16_9FIRM|nr:TIM barrel protein [Alkalibaculum sporogenes]MPW26604.1 TIM barrel protein [Alkalibaculum sporogenes]
MKYLINMVNHESKLSWFENDWAKLRLYLQEYKIDGVELIFYHDYDISAIPNDIAEGMHLIYYPTWLDFWTNNKQNLYDQFREDDNIIAFYGSLDRQSMVDKYKEEFKVAQEMKTSYMVFHVAHVEVEHTFTWEFTYTDKEVLDAATDMINEIYGEVDKGVTLLFENLWWPGLNFLDPVLTKEFFNKINYPNKGFVLDIGHIMITNKELKTLEEACNYIKYILDRNPFLIEHIKTIHLNKSLTGKYLREDHGNKLKKVQDCDNIWDSLTETRNHISNIDTHVPFDYNGIVEIINKVNPSYVVYEFLPSTLQELTNMIELQNEVLGR